MKILTEKRVKVYRFLGQELVSNYNSYGKLFIFTNEGALLQEYNKTAAAWFAAAEYGKNIRY